MVNKGQIQVEETEDESSDEIDYSDFLEYFKDELAQALVNYIKCEQKYLSKMRFSFGTYHLKKRIYKNQMIKFI